MKYLKSLLLALCIVVGCEWANGQRHPNYNYLTDIRFQGVDYNTKVSSLRAAQNAFAAKAYQLAKMQEELSYIKGCINSELHPKSYQILEKAQTALKDMWSFLSKTGITYTTEQEVKNKKIFEESIAKIYKAAERQSKHIEEHEAKIQRFETAGIPLVWESLYDPRYISLDNYLSQTPTIQYISYNDIHNCYDLQAAWNQFSEDLIKLEYQTTDTKNYIGEFSGLYYYWKYSDKGFSVRDYRIVMNWIKLEMSRR